MSEKQKPKVIILDDDPAIVDQAKSALIEAGWDVVCEMTGKAALERLAQSKKSLFALFISDSKLPKMEGDNILQKVMELSPFTQRMLMVPTDDPDMLINAINKAKIHSCITRPFNDNDLVLQAKICFKNFKQAIKKEQLKRVTTHQNKQMFKIAQKLKKKDASCKKLIAEKKAKKTALKSSKRMEENKQRKNVELSLDDLMEHKGIQLVPDAYKNEFLFLSKTLKDLFSPLISENDMDPELLDIKAALIDDSSENDGEDSSENSKTEKETGESTEETDPAADSQQTESTGPEGEENEEESPKDDATDEKGIDPPKDLIETIVKKTLTNAMDLVKDQEPAPPQQAVVLDVEEDDTTEDDSQHKLEKFYKITVSKDLVTAQIKMIKEPSETDEITLENILDLLRHKQISYGILEDEAIETWLTKSQIEQITIAQGDAPVHGESGSIKYHFETNFTNPGKINEDGSIDFRDRGEIPYVSADALLAVKTPAKEGKNGMSVTSTPIVVEEIEDPVFVAGPGAKLSDDELSILADLDGQPHLDAMGTVSVNPEIVIPGDVDFESGNVDFKGNIVVKGMVKEGFTVKGINLTAKEIEGGIIDISGDLNVSAGITDASIKTQGNIYAKFINNSKIQSFGDLNISKEIIDSDILLSGRCDNQTGHIISSTISAKMGIDAGKIGTPASSPSKIKVGIDEHTKKLKAQIEEALEASVAKSGIVKEEIKKLEDDDQALYQQISEKAHIQDRSQIEIKELKEKLADLKSQNDVAGAQKVTKEIVKKAELAKQTEQELNTIFETQDTIAIDISKLRTQIEALEEENKTHVLEKRALKTFAKKDEPCPVLNVSKTIVQDTVITGPHSTIVLSEDKSRCKIQELKIQEEGINLFEINIGDL